MTLNIAAFHEAQRQTEAAAARGDWAHAQITPEQWEQMGGDPNQYSQLYGPTAYYNADGSLTNQGQAAGLQPVKGTSDANRLEPGTGVKYQGGIPTAPAGPTESAADQIALAEQYARWNAQMQAQENRVNEVTPYGSARYIRNPDGTVTRITDLSDWQQRLLEQQQGQDYEIGNAAARNLQQYTNAGPVDYSGLPQIAGTDDLLAERKRVEDVLYGNWKNRYEPEFQRQKEQLQQSFADRGLPPTSAQAQQEMAQLERNQNDARQNAMSAASMQGLSEYETGFNTSLQNRQNAVGEYNYARQAPLSEMISLQAAQRGLTSPGVSDLTRLNIQTVDPAAIGQVKNQQELSKYLGDLDAETRRAVAEIQANAAIEGARIGAEGEDFNDVEYDDNNITGRQFLSSSTKPTTAATTRKKSTISPKGGYGYSSGISNYGF